MYGANFVKTDSVVWIQWLEYRKIGYDVFHILLFILHTKM